jgi:HlyD family secretion protein
MKQLVYIIGLATLCQSCSSEQTSKHKILEGKIEREQLSVTTKIPGRVEKILVTEGQWVHKGDTLMILEIPEVDAKSLQAKGALEAAQAQYEMAVKGATDGQIKQLRAKVDGLKEQYEFAHKSLDRMHNLLADSLVSQQKYDEVYVKYQGAKNQYLAAQAELADVEKGARMEQQKMALGQKERALGAVSEVNAAAQERYVIAPQDMSIETINLKVGELALAGYSLASGYIADATFFRITVPESRMKDFSKGAIKTLQIPYLDHKRIQARVETIKALSSYASISTAYPDFEQQEAVFEIKLKAVHTEETKDLLTKASFIVEDNK